MSNNLDKIRALDKDRIDSEHYFESLLIQAQEKGLVNDGEIERIQYACLNFLAYRVERYNAGDSSSIQIEKAQGIMTSIFFTLGVWLKTYPNPDDALNALLHEPISGIYQKGRKRIDSLMRTTKTLHKQLMHNLLDTQNVFYRSTLENGINGFFKLYRPDFAAQEIHITADYPLFNHTPRLLGIEFIKAYVEAAYYENRFCTLFPPYRVHRLLCRYSENYAEQLFNIYEYVLSAAIACIIVKNDCLNLDINKSMIETLRSTFSGKSVSDISEIISDAAGELSKRFEFSKGLGEYIRNSLPIIARKIKTAMRAGNLTLVFLCK